jgi:hypothetical protein
MNMRPTTTASNLFRRFLCPGSARLEEGLPEEDSEQSREGRLLHDYDVHPEYDRAFLTDEQRRLLSVSQMLTSRIFESVGRDRTGEYLLEREQQLFSDDISGTPDMVFYWPEDFTIWVNDKKFGYNLVERAELNLQLRAYAILVQDRFLKKVERTFVSIVQPRVAYDERITMAQYSPDDIEQSRKQIRQIIERTKDPKAPLVAGEIQCRYCKGKLVCPEFRKMMDQPLVTFQTDGEWTVAKRAEYIEHRLSKCSDQDLAQLLQAIGLATMVKESANEEARKRIRDGRLPTHTLGKEFSVRSIADVKRAFALLSLSRIQTTEQLMNMVTLSIKPVEEAYHAATGCTWKEAHDKINNVLSSVIKRDTRKAKVIKK